ncbi:MAG: phospholipase/carboxylesterase [Planctomycetaceae bacterium]
MPFEMRQIAGLNCLQFDELPKGESPEIVTVICHGFGASGDDLAGLGPEMLHRQPQLASKIRFLFPEAPLSLDSAGIPGGRAWWHLDMEKLNAAIATGQIRDLRNDYPDELPAARKMLMNLIQDIQTETGLPTDHFILTGFSQGAMLSTDVTLRLPEPPGLLGILSGTLICEEEWRELASQRGRIPVFQSHGDQDPILPFCAAEWLRDMLIDAGLDVEFMPFSGMHTIPVAVIDRLAARLTEFDCD